MKILFFDLETTGVLVNKNGIHQISGCIVIDGVEMERFDEGNIQGYRRGLIRKYGEQRVLILEAEKSTIRQYSDFEYKVLIKHYTEEVNKLKKEKCL